MYLFSCGTVHVRHDILPSRYLRWGHTPRTTNTGWVTEFYVQSCLDTHHRAVFVLLVVGHILFQ